MSSLRGITFKPNYWIKQVFIIAALLFSITVYSQSSEIKTIRIEAGNLAETLPQIAEAFGIDIVASGDALSGIASPAIEGTMSAGDAISRLLEGSGLKAIEDNGNGFFISTLEQKEESENNEQPGLQIEDKQKTVEVIVVTGTKQNLSIQETQTSVAIVTQEQIAEQVLFNLEDVVFRTPNVSTARGIREVSIRGIGINGSGLAGTGTTINVYMDNAPVSSFGREVAFNLWDVEQVEVLRGPQSTIQGRNALAGAIVLQTADPEYEFGAAVRANAGNFEQRRFSGMVNVPIIEDQLAFRLVADFRESDFGVLSSVTGNSVSFEETEMYRGKLLFEPNSLDGLRIEIGAQYAESFAGATNFLFSPPTSSPEFGSFDPFGDENFDQQARVQDFNTTRVNANLKYDFNENWSGIAIGTYEESEINSLALTGPFLGQEETTSVELRAAFDYDRLRGWFGAYYFDENAVTASDRVFDIEALGQISDPSGGIVFLVQSTERRTDNYALFANFTFDLTTRLQFNFGARYDWEDLFDTGQRGSLTQTPSDCTLPAFGGIPCVNAFRATMDPAAEPSYEAFLPRGALIYNFDDNRSFSFSIQRGYRAGGASVQSTPTGGIIQEFDPEFLTNYEVAFRWQSLDKKLTVNGNAFYSDWTDQQVVLPGPLGFGGQTVNAGSSELYGAEISVSAQFSDGLDAFFNLGLLETEYSNFPFAVDANGDPLPGDGVTIGVDDTTFANLAGNAFPSAPNLTMSAGVNYEHPSGFFVNANVSYKGKQFSDVENFDADEADSYVLTNARFGYRHNRFEVSAFVNNLFDERYITQRSTRQVFASSSSVAINDAGQQGFVVNDPRVYGVELTASF